MGKLRFGNVFNTANIELQRYQTFELADLSHENLPLRFIDFIGYQTDGFNPVNCKFLLCWGCWVRYYFELKADLCLHIDKLIAEPTFLFAFVGEFPHQEPMNINFISRLCELLHYGISLWLSCSFLNHRVQSILY